MTNVSVTESSVSVVSVGEPNKSQVVGTYKKVTITPWERASKH